ncbi:MAG: hypothetical protein K0Q55_497 [Verrucomicrobia bacterium]|jgi:hypothetical protein|nr:hypothetical protein [Verrucomicrobiota bacterium]
MKRYWQASGKWSGIYDFGFTNYEGDEVVVIVWNFQAD